MSLRESTVEDTALGWFQDLDYAVFPGPPRESMAEHDSFSNVVLKG